MKRFIMVLLSAVAATAAMLALLVPAAQAAPAAPAQPAAAAQPADAAAAGCPADKLCLYENPNFTGVQQNFGNGEQVCSLGQLNDGVSSVINNRNNRAVLYARPGCAGDTLNVPAGKRFDNLRDQGFNDKANGVKLF